jgi:predicted transcriptional regulator
MLINIKTLIDDIDEQIASELDLNRTDVQKMTTQLRDGIVKKASCNPSGRGGVR